MEEIIRKIDNFLKINDGKLISKISEYKNAKTKLKWMCKFHHEFESSWNKVQQGRWCPYCAGKYLSILDAKNIAQSRGGYCLSDTYIKCIDKLLWECEMGHQWKASLNSVKNSKTWCPYCSTSIGESVCRLFLEKLFNEKFPKIRPPWLKTKNSSLELDGYSEKLGIAFEYQGAHHFEKSYKKQNLEKVKKHDWYKKSICQKMGIKLLIINDCENNKVENIRSQIINNIDVKYIDTLKKINISDIDLYKRNYMENLHLLANNNDGECLSDKFIGSKEKYRWKCKNNHIWESSLYSVKTGSWCKKCKNINLMDNLDIAREIGIIRDVETDVYKKKILQKAIKYLSVSKTRK